jgi:hypothetical protein
MVDSESPKFWANTLTIVSIISRYFHPSGKGYSGVAPTSQEKEARMVGFHRPADKLPCGTYSTAIVIFVAIVA